LELLENVVFSFATRGAVQYLCLSITEGSCVFMIVCSCNVLSDHDVRQAVSSADDLPRSAKEVYGCLGCSVECGRCVRTVKIILDETLGPCARMCQAGCAHSHSHAAPDLVAQSEFALAAS
jgi:bacterioferritin-associated ferredoxin